MLIDNSQLNARRHARLAGAIYLLNVLTGIFALGYVPAQTGGHGDAATTVQNITAHEALFRAGIVAGAICYLAFLLLPLVLYRLLGATHRVAGVAMVALATASVPIGFVTLGHKLDVLTLLGHAAWLQPLSATQIHTQVMLQLDAYGNGLLLAQVFWGLWLLPFGWLVIRGRQLPRLLGYLLVLGGLSYVLDFAAQLLVPGYSDTAFASYVTTPAALGEIGTCLWLLIVGARPAATA
ncbi:DUF4386 domain-containing protein [Dyella sp.]|uniref:DUF4386 domain-containing protein n=1 Tax=Dyella sp. TaxID=1869338 RepID=UPI003F807F27